MPKAFRAIALLCSVLVIAAVIPSALADEGTELILPYVPARKEHRSVVLIHNRVTLQIGSDDAAAVHVATNLDAGEIRRWNFAELARAGKLPPGSTQGWFAVHAASGVRAKLFVERLLLNRSPFGRKTATRTGRISVRSGGYQPPEGDDPVVDDGSTVRVQEIAAEAVDRGYEEGNASSLTIPFDVTVYWTDGSTSGASGATMTTDSPHVSVDANSLSATVATGEGEGDGEGWEGGVTVGVIDECATQIVVKVLVSLSTRASAYEYTGMNQGFILDHCLWRATCTGACSTSGCVSVKIHGAEPCFDPGAPYLQSSDLLINSPNGPTCFRKVICRNIPFPGVCL